MSSKNNEVLRGAPSATVEEGSSAFAARLKTLKEYLLRDPGNVRLRSDCIALALRLGDPVAAKELAVAWLAGDPSAAEAKFQLANAHISSGDFATAVELLTSIKDSEAATAVAQNHALCLYMLGRYSEAVPVLQGCIERGDLGPALPRMLISSLHHLNRMVEAEQTASSVDWQTESDPGLAGVLGLLYLDSGNAAKANEYGRAALAAQPDSLDGLVVCGTVDVAEGRMADAREAFKRALEIKPDVARAWIGLGLLALHDRDLKAAREQMKRGLELLPGHVGSWLVLGWIELMSGNLEAAHGVFLHALELDRNFDEVHGGLAVVAALRRDVAGARVHIAVAQRLNSNGASARFAEAVLSGVAGRSDDVRKFLMDAIAKAKFRTGRR